MKLSQFKKLHPLNRYSETKKLFFDAYPIKIKIRWDGCRLLHRHGKEKPPAWITSAAGTDLKTMLVLRGETITIDPTEFRNLYKFLKENPPPKIRYDDPRYSSNGGHIFLYFMHFDEAHEYLSKFPYNNKMVEITAPLIDLQVGQVVVADHFIEAGYRYRVNLNTFVIERTELKRYRDHFKRCEDEIYLPPSFKRTLWEEWGPKRTSWWMSNKYFYTADLKIVTLMGLSLPNLIKSVNDLVTNKEIFIPHRI